MMRCYLVLAVLLVNVLIGGEFWTNKKAGDWTAEERERVLSHSPWAKPAAAGLDVTRGTGGFGPGAYGGQVGGGAPERLPELRAVIRWESAVPIREGEKKPLPEEAKGFLVLSVTMTGMLTVTEGDEELLRGTSLKAKGKAPVNPARLLRDEKSRTILYLFADRASVSPDDKEWAFETSFGTLVLKAKFVAKEMQYLGKPAL